MQRDLKVPSIAKKSSLAGAQVNTHKLKATDDWEITQKELSLHELIQMIEQICVGFDNHKQEVFHLMQVLKMQFLHTQSKNEMVEDHRVWCTPKCIKK
jgi:hypothetical protein